MPKKEFTAGVNIEKGELCYLKEGLAYPYNPLDSRNSLPSNKEIIKLLKANNIGLNDFYEGTISSGVVYHKIATLIHKRFIKC